MSSVAVGFAAWSIAPAGVAAQGLPDRSPLSDCVVRGQTDVSRRLIALPQDGSVGDPVQAVVTLRTSCRAPVQPAHIVLVLDRAVVAEERTGPAVASLRSIAQAIRSEDRTYARMALVDYDKLAREHCKLTNDPVALNDCLTERAAAGVRGTVAGLNAAVAQAMTTTRNARVIRYPPHHNGVDALDESIVVLADEPGEPCPIARELVEAARAEGVDVDVLCDRGDCFEPHGCLASLALPNALHGGRDADWQQVEGWINSRIRSAELRVHAVSILEWVHPALDVIASTLDASAVSFVPADNQLQWTFRDIGARTRYSYAFRATRPGLIALRRDGWLPYRASYRDTRGRTGSVSLGNPSISVIDHAPFRALIPLGWRPDTRSGFRPLLSPRPVGAP